jgi:myo-inositol 2-dehydrogenase/D-chiro-inositol 1-dehydrogenase
MGGVHLHNLLDLGCAVSVYSVVESEELAAGRARVCQSYDELLDSVDWVLIATPTDTHHDLATAALRAGRDLIVEKPLARTAAEAADLMTTAEAAGRQVWPGHVVRFFPEYRALRDAVAGGRLGELAVLRFTRAGRFPDRSPWFADVPRSGGIVMDQMIHDLDIALWLAGPVSHVSAVGHHDDSGPVPVHVAHVTLRHASGAISLASGTWGAPDMPFLTSFSVAGTGGVLEHASEREQTTLTYLDRSIRADGDLPAYQAGRNPYRDELAAFLDPPSSPTVTGWDAVEAVRVAEAALRSLETGEPEVIA